MSEIIIYKTGNVYYINERCFCVRATILQHENSQFGKVNTESVAKPAVIRAGAEGDLILIHLIEIKLIFLFCNNFIIHD